MAKLNFKKAGVKKSVPSEFWSILIVDDDPEIHAMTNLVMRDWIFNGKGLKIYTAESSAETRKILDEKGSEIAMILLDVVMENDHSGLDLVKYIRDILHNRLTRIVLRTGQPGKAPVRKIISEYEINDYKEKNELTADRLYVTVAAALRNYEDLINIERNRAGLEKVLKATSDLFNNLSISSFTEGVLTQISGIIKADESSLLVQYESQQSSIEDSLILAGTGIYKEYTYKNLEVLNKSTVYELIKKGLDKKESFFEEDSYVVYIPLGDKKQNVLVFKGLSHVSEYNKELIRIFSANVSMASANLHLTGEIEEIQRESINTFGNVLEFRSCEPAGHIQRVTETALTIGRALNLSGTDLRILEFAAPFHDIGKISLPLEILQKPGPLNNEEFKIVQTHSRSGYNLLKGSGRDILKRAALIALDHHERWDGNGYPNNKKGEEISLDGRIIAIADVFDALYNKRIYKEPWLIENIISLIKEERGRHFDPAVADAFIENIDDILAIQIRNKDEI